MCACVCVHYKHFPLSTHTHTNKTEAVWIYSDSLWFLFFSALWSFPIKNKTWKTKCTRHHVKKLHECCVFLWLRSYHMNQIWLDVNTVHWLVNHIPICLINCLLITSISHDNWLRLSVLASSELQSRLQTHIATFHQTQLDSPLMPGTSFALAAMTHWHYITHQLWT